MCRLCTGAKITQVFSSVSFDTYKGGQHCYFCFRKLRHGMGQWRNPKALERRDKE